MNAEQTPLDLETLCEWGKPVLLETKSGYRNLRKAVATERFWKAWKDHKPELSAAGISCGLKVRDDRKSGWVALWWQDPPAGLQEKLQENLKNSQAKDSDRDLPRPEVLEYLGYQKAGIVFALDKDGVLFGDEMGLGKTIQAIGVINADPTLKKILVICPASLKINWLRELKKWLVRPLRPFVAQSTIGFPDFADIVIINFDILTKFPVELSKKDHWDAVIVDEAHFIKTAKSQRTMAVRSIQARRRICLTGTPIPNRAKELFNIVNWLQPSAFPSYYKFLYKYCGGSNDLEKLQTLQTKLRTTVMVRRLKRDVLTELPAKRRQVIEIPCNDPSISSEIELTRRSATELEALQAALELAKVSDNEQDYQDALAALQAGVRLSLEEMSRVRHETAVAKIPYVITHLEECMTAGTKVVFFAHHRDVIEAVHQHFRERAVLHYGGLSEVDKQTAVDSFQNDPDILLFTGSIKASGVGITLTASSHVVFGELDWVPGNISQCEDRTHRIGQKEAVLVQHLVLEGSIDATMAHSVIEKQKVIDLALDRDADKLRAEPIVPSVRKAVTSINVTRSEIEEQAITIRRETIVAVHVCLRVLAGVCDGALKQDEMGFNGVDARIGKSLANALFLSPKQAVLGQKLIRKYKRQLPEDAYTAALEKPTVVTVVEPKEAA